MFNKSNRRKNICFLSIVLLLFMNVSAMAGEQERSELAQVAREIDILMGHVEKIKSKSHASSQDRILFHYDDLISDLGTIKEGISDYINAELRNGNPINPLDGRYR